MSQHDHYRGRRTFSGLGWALVGGALALILFTPLGGVFLALVQYALSGH